VLVTGLGDLVGELLEGLVGQPFRSWEFASIQVAVVNVPGGALVGWLGAVSGSWARGLGIGAAVHALVFAGLIASSASFQAAPDTVTGWVLAVGIMTGGIAGGLGGLISRLSWRQRQTTAGRPIA
jgi:hypothetical protein